MSSLLVLALSLPTAAFGATKYDSYLGGVGSSDISGVVDVPLLSGPYHDEMPYVWVRFGADDKDPHLFLVDLGGSSIVLSEATAKELGLKVKSHDMKLWKSLGKKADEKAWGLAGEVKTTSVSEMRLSDALVFHKVDAVVSYVPQSGSEGDPLGLGAVAGIIGVGATGLSAAILPSQGLVRFAPRDQGAQLLSQIGTPVAFTPVESDIVKYSQGKEYHPRILGVVDATVSGQPFKMAISTSLPFSTIDRSFKPGSEPRVPLADQDLYWASTSLGATSLGSTWLLYGNAGMAPWPGQNGVLGYALLRQTDIGVDPASAQLALAPAATQKRTSPLTDLIALKTTALTDLDKPAEGEEAKKKAEPKDEKAANKEKAGILTSRGSLYLAAGQTDLAITDLKQAVELNPDPCEGYSLLGNAYAMAVRPDEAAEAYIKALDLYTRWVSLPREERARISKMEEKDLESVATKPQDLDACSDTAGLLATTDLMRGRYDRVIELYGKEKDLHPQIYLAAGIAMIRTGRVAEAQGPLRQSLNRGLMLGEAGGGDPYRYLSRAGLAHLFDVKGEYPAALELMEKEALSLSADPLLMDLYADIIRHQKGPDAPIPALQDLVKRYPDSIGGWTVLGAELDKVGNPEAKTAWGQALKVVDQELAARQDHPELLALKAYIQARSRDDAAARPLAEKALKLQANNPYAALALSMVEVRAGEYANGRKHFDEAVGTGALNVGFSRLRPPRGAAPTVVVTDTRFELSEKVFFETGKDTLLPESLELLAVVASTLKANPQILLVRVEGHTDARGAADQNMTLSQKRAEAVVASLVRMGVEPARLKAQGLGSTVPLDPASTEDAWEKNRRVEFVIEQKAPPPEAPGAKKPGKKKGGK